MKVTFCIPSKDNLRYLKWSIPSIRKNAHYKEHDIIVFVDKDTDGTTAWLESVKDEYSLTILKNPSDTELYGIGRAYDTMIDAAKTEIVCVFHADMYLCKDADLHAINILTNQKSKNAILRQGPYGIVVSSTRIEPPLHPEGKEKIVRDFGLWPESDVPDGFKEDELNTFVASLQQQPSADTDGVFAPWYVFKDDIVQLGGHDYQFRSAREDSDLFNRMKLAGWDIVQSWKSFVYHLTCRAGQFQHGVLTTVHTEKSKEWQELMNESTRAFIKKWQSPVRTTETLHPVVMHKYNVTVVARRFSYPNGLNYLTDFPRHLEQLKLLCNNLVLISDESDLDLTTLDDIVIVDLPGASFEGMMQLLLHLSDMLNEPGIEPGVYEAERCRIYVNKIHPVEDALIYKEWLK